MAAYENGSKRNENSNSRCSSATCLPCEERHLVHWCDIWSFILQILPSSVDRHLMGLLEKYSFPEMMTAIWKRAKDEQQLHSAKILVALDLQKIHWETRLLLEKHKWCSHTGSYESQQMSFDKKWLFHLRLRKYNTYQFLKQLNAKNVSRSSVKLSTLTRMKSMRKMNQIPGGWNCRTTAILLNVPTSGFILQQRQPVLKTSCLCHLSNCGRSQTSKGRLQIERFIGVMQLTKTP